MGYLSRTYTSQIHHIKDTNQAQPKTHYNDTFVPLYDDGPWVLTKRSLRVEPYEEVPERQLTYSFLDLLKL